ncbi:MAG: peroxiredoxin [Pseudomonadota bacterium]
MLKWLLTALVAGMALLLWRMSVFANRNLPRPGDSAPDFELPDQNSRPRASAQFRGRWLVLYFYPRDDTRGCTEQAARFREAMSEFDALDAAVCGVSVDGSESHAKFVRKYNLPFTLLADKAGVVAARYGSLRNFGFMKLAKRNTFLIDPQGRVARVYLGVNPARNARAVVDDLRKQGNS